MSKTVITVNYKNGLRKLWNFIYVTLNPRFWPQCDHYNKKLDDELLESMLKYKWIHKDGAVHAKLNNKEYWVGNYPYGAFTYKDKRPSRTTIYIAYKKFYEDTGVDLDTDPYN